MPHKNDQGEQNDGIPRIPIGWRTLLVVALMASVELGLKHVGGFGWWAMTERSERYGWRMLPDQDARSRDLSIVERINSYGFRDRDWDPPIPDGAGGWRKDESLYRVAVVGNSYTYGTSVPIERVYTRELEDLIQADLDARGIEKQALVMNFAVQGYCLEQMARVYEDVIRPFQVDLLIVPCHSHDAFPMAPAFDDPDYDFRRWIIRSATYDMLVRHVINRWIPPPPGMDVASATDKAGGEDDDVNWRKLDKDMLERPFAREFRPLWDQAGERMAGLDDMLAEDDGKLLIVMLPRHRKYFQPNLRDPATYWAGWAWEHRERVGITLPWKRFEEEMRPVIGEIAAKGMADGPTADLSKVTWTDADGTEHPGTELETAEQSLHLLFDMGHLTARGHRVMAEEIFVTLGERGLLPDAP